MTCNCEICRIHKQSRKKQIKYFSKRISRLKKAIKRLKDRGIRKPTLLSENPLEHELACLVDDIMHCVVLRKEAREGK